MLTVREIALLCAILAPTSLLAITAWWSYRKIWYLSVFAAVTAVGIVLYLPIRNAFAPLPESLQFLAVGEFVMFGSLIGVLHLTSILAIILRVAGEIVAKRKGETRGKNHEIPGND